MSDRARHIYKSRVRSEDQIKALTEAAPATAEALRARRAALQALERELSEFLAKAEFRSSPPQ